MTSSTSSVQMGSRSRTTRRSVKCRHRLNGYLAQRVPSLFLANSFRTCLDCEVFKGMFPWRTIFIIVNMNNTVIVIIIITVNIINSFTNIIIAITRRLFNMIIFVM